MNATCFADRSGDLLRKAVMVVSATVMLASLTVAAGAQTPAQAGREVEDKTIDAAVQAEIIDSVCLAFNQVYVFPDVAKKMEKHVRDRFKKKAYADLTSTRAFADQLTEDFREISHDRHIGIAYVSDEDVAMMGREEPTDEERQRELRAQQRGNFGWKEVKILPGNIGYVDLRGFADAVNAGATAIAAMNFLAHTDAVIFDLRQNGGGSPSMIQLISSYLFDEPKHLNSFYIRKDDTIQQFWTQEYVVGPRMADVDVYVLTSKRTFSAAEEFTYNLKNMKRATIVGETTGGGAHPVEGHFFANLNIQMRVPFGRAINPVSGTNWEGTGVAPDIDVPQEQALDVAYREALKKVKDRLTDPDERYPVEWVLQGLEAKANPVTIDRAVLAKYTGEYGPRTVRVDGDALVYQRGENPPMKMIPMTPTLFRFDEIDYFRLEIVLDEAGKPVELIGHYDNGMVDKSPRTN